MSTQSLYTGLKAQIQSAIAGINKNFGNVTQVTLQGTATTPKDLVQLFQSCLNAIDATISLGSQWHAAVAAQQQLVVQVRLELAGLKAYAINQYGKASPVLSDFGIVLGARKVPTAAVKAVAVEKGLETKKVRGPTGKRQRAMIKASAVPATATGTPVKA